MKNITKGQKISLDKEINSKSFFIGLKWDQTFAPDYEIDTSIMLLSDNGKLEKEENFVFYNNLSSPNGAIKIQNKALDNYKKIIEVNLDKVEKNISRIMFILTIESGDELNHRFNKIKNISANLIDLSKNSLLEYKVDDLNQETAVIIFEIYNHNNEWKLQATGNGFNSGLSALLDQYGSDAVKVADEPTSTKINQQPTKINTSLMTPTIINNFNVPKISSNRPKNNMNKVPKGSKEFVKDYTQSLEIVNKQLATKNILNQNAQIVVALDLSCSMSIMLRDGTIHDTFDKIMPLVMQLDDDGLLDVFPFNENAYNNAIPFTMENRERYIQYEILFKYNLGGTGYSSVIEKITNKYSNAGKSSDPVYVIFITDGDCDDQNQTETAIKNASNKGIFWQFIGVGEKRASFSFLNKLDKLSGRKVDNANFFYIYDLNKITKDELYDGLLSEFPEWLKSAKQQGIIN
ncbi:MAG: VWA domain-containing protein [Candidatus Sericytochromatia bacterium]|nr:VWA domain-containing protein [Candidatus Sericytochromatia bacterium]